jgi:hypothetical protein
MAQPAGSLLQVENAAPARRASPVPSQVPTQRGARVLSAELGSDADTGRSRQLVAEAVRRSTSGDSVVVGAAEVTEPSGHLLAFLVAAGQAARLRGASLSIAPARCALALRLRDEGLLAAVVG